MRESKIGQFIIPKRMREQLGLNQDAELKITTTAQGLRIQNKTTAQHPVDRVCGVLDSVCDVDIYLEEIRGT